MNKSNQSAKMKILFLGTHGQKNIGDELLLETFLYKLRENYDFLVNSYTPKETAEKFNVKTFDTQNERIKMMKYINNSDVVIFGGGSIVKEMYPEYGRSRYSVLFILLAISLYTKIIARKKLIFSNIGIGPLKKKFSFFLAKLILSCGDFISVRDTNSLEYANIVVPKKKVLQVPDAVFALNKDYFGLKENKANSTKTIAVNLCKNIEKPSNWKYFIDQLTKSIINVHKKHPEFEFVGLPMQYDYSIDDIKTLKMLKEKLSLMDKTIKFSITKPNSVEDIIKIINNAHLVVAERLHTNILSIITNTPFVALEYDIKVQSLLKNHNLEKQGLNINEKFKDGLIQEKIENSLSNYDLIKKSLEKISKNNNEIVTEYFNSLKTEINK
ncbi:polysaccharide pyruvyl transferase family protein [Candidatus Dojkabacteria bacterium]|nr:polysaccharide pyruvyl transferase family protein [Candidatus Dojkabacteria bacterium]